MVEYAYKNVEEQDPHGPVSGSEIRRLCLQGTISAGTLIARYGSTRWTAARDIEALKALFARGQHASTAAARPSQDAALMAVGESTPAPFPAFPDALVSTSPLKAGCKMVLLLSAVILLLGTGLMLLLLLIISPVGLIGIPLIFLGIYLAWDHKRRSLTPWRTSLSTYYEQVGDYSNDMASSASDRMEAIKRALPRIGDVELLVSPDLPVKRIASCLSRRQSPLLPPLQFEHGDRILAWLASPSMVLTERVVLFGKSTFKWEEIEWALPRRTLVNSILYINGERSATLGRGRARGIARVLHAGMLKRSGPCCPHCGSLNLEARVSAGRGIPFALAAIFAEIMRTILLVVIALPTGNPAHLERHGPQSAARILRSQPWAYRCLDCDGQPAVVPKAR